MMKKIFAMLVFLLLIISVLPSVIAEEDDTCTVDADCSEGEFCEDGACEETDGDACSVDADCEEGFVCDDNECEEEDSTSECTTDADCSEGEVCDDEGECKDSSETVEDDDSDQAVEDEDDVDEDEDSDETGEELDDDKEAEDEEELEIEDEVEAFESNLGGKIRLAVLEKKISWAIARGEIVVNYQEEKYAGADLAYLDELDSILDKLSAIIIDLQDLQESGSDAETYSDLRKDSWRLVREFKRIAWKNTSPGDREEIKDRLKAADYSFLKDSRDKIKDWVREHNAEKAKEILEHFGEENPGLVERVRNGEVSPSDIRNELKDRYRSLKDDIRDEARRRLGEARDRADAERDKVRERFREETDAIRDKRLDALEERREQRKEDLRELRDNIRARVVGVMR